RIEIDETTEIVLRARANLVELGERGELRLREALDHARGKDRRMALHRDAHEEPDLIIKHIAIFRYVGLGYDFQFFTPQCFHRSLPFERRHPIPSDKSFAPPGWRRARRPSPANEFDPFPEHRPGPTRDGQNGCSARTAGSTIPAFSARESCSPSARRSAAPPLLKARRAELAADYPSTCGRPSASAAPLRARGLP